MFLIKKLPNYQHCSFCIYYRFSKNPNGTEQMTSSGITGTAILHQLNFYWSNVVFTFLPNLNNRRFIFPSFCNFSLYFAIHWKIPVGLFACRQMFSITLSYNPFHMVEKTNFLCLQCFISILMREKICSIILWTFFHQCMEKCRKISIWVKCSLILSQKGGYSNTFPFLLIIYVWWLKFEFEKNIMRQRESLKTNNVHTKYGFHTVDHQIICKI